MRHVHPVTQPIACVPRRLSSAGPFVRDRFQLLPHHLQAHSHGQQPDPDLRSGHYPEMGRLVTDAGKRNWDALTAEYGAQLMEGLGVMDTRGKHVNVLQHLIGFLKNHLSSGDNPCRRQALSPLIVPLTLLKHHLHRYPVPEWVHEQVYLNPYPKELMLRNRV